jgi:hypothetical protein
MAGQDVAAGARTSAIRVAPLVAFGAAFTTVFALILVVALPLWLLFRLPQAIVSPGSTD